jgi:eukaryotic-like serine/threonine-protein kinase
MGIGPPGRAGDERGRATQPSPSGLPSSPELPAFLQARVALLGKVLAVVGGAIWAVRALADVALGHPERLVQPVHLLGALVATPPLAMWLLCTGPRRSTAFVRAVEASCLIATSTILAASGRYLSGNILEGMARSIPWQQAPAAPLVAGLLENYISVAFAVGLTQIMAARCALVPSSTRHTLLLVGVVGVPLIAFGGLGVIPMEVDRALREAARPADRIVVAVSTGLVWASTMAICACISRVVYSLRKEVRHALQLGQYTLQDKLGEGGMGVVYRAHHALMRRPTAVKLLLPDKADATSLARFEREVQLTARLTHPNTVTIFDYGHTSDGVFYYAMELLEGATIADVVEAAGPQPPERVIAVLRMVASALREAHDLGLIHRDIKPANVILCERGGEVDVAKVVDFGLVKPIQQAGDPVTTQAGICVGTPLYMAPEALVSPDDVDARSDLYAVGALGYFMVTGRQLFEADTPLEVVSHQLRSMPLHPSERLGAPVPADLVGVLMTCLQKDREQRFPNAAALCAALERCGDARSWTQERARAWWADHGTKLLNKPSPDAPRSQSAAHVVDASDRLPTVMIRR